MIDQLIVQGPLGTPLQRHQACLSQVTYSRLSTSKSKPTTTFVLSPITGAQIDVLYWVEDVAGPPTAFAQITLPLSSATVGHNYAHAGLGSILYETQCARLLCQVVLTVLGFTPAEVGRFVDEAKGELLELTWHTPTASERALRSLQSRTKRVFDSLLLIKSRHDVCVSDVDYQEGNGKPGLLVTFKNRVRFRQYGKADHIASRKKRDRNRNWISKEARKHRPLILNTIKVHARNEFIFVAQTLKEADASHPRSWTAEKLLAIIDDCWKKAGLGVSSELPGESRLSPEAAATLHRCRAGELPRDFLPSHTHTRHRKSILATTGEDIDNLYKRNAVRPESVGYQLQYRRRWEPSGLLRKLVLSEESAPAIIEELERGLAYLETGEIPDFPSAAERSEWLQKWKSFQQREGGPKTAQINNADDGQVMSGPVTPPAVESQFGRGFDPSADCVEEPDWLVAYVLSGDPAWLHTRRSAKSTAIR